MCSVVETIERDESEFILFSNVDVLSEWDVCEK